MQSILRKHEYCAGMIICRKITNSNYEYLLMQNKHGAWACPKGHLERQETQLEAAIREVQEETNLKHKIHYELLDDFEAQKITYPLRHGNDKTVTFFLAKLTDLEAQVKVSREHIAFEWVSIDTACERTVKYQNLYKILQAASEFMERQTGN